MSGRMSENVSRNVAAIANDSDAGPLGDADMCNSFDTVTSASNYDYVRAHAIT